MQVAFLNGNASYIVDHLQDLNEKITDDHIKFLKKRVEYWFEFGNVSYPSSAKDEVYNLLPLLEYECD